MCQGYCMVVFENECKKTNTRSRTQKYLSLGKFTLAPLCELRTIRIVQEKRQETFVVIIVGRHAESCELQTIKDRAIVRWGDTDAVGMRILAAKRVNNPA